MTNIPITPPARPRSRRRRLLTTLLVTLALAALMLVVQSPLRRATLQRSVLAATGPSDEDMALLVQHTSDPADTLARLWQTGKVAHRQFVIGYLREHAAQDPRLWPAARPLAMEAARCGDVDVTLAALVVLSQAHDPEAEPTALRLLNDADPELRRGAVRHLAGTEDKRFLPAFAARLDDPDAGVRALAAAALRDLTDQDFGLRFDSDDAKVKSAAHDWRQWLAEHRQDFPDPPPAPGPLPPVVGRSTDFTSYDLAGRPVHLSDFRGKVVLLNFWATWCPPCIQEIPTLVELARRRPDRVVVLGVSADAVGEGHDEDDDHEGDEHGHGKDSGSNDVAALVGRVVREKGINYPVVIDRTGEAIAAYRGDGLPTTVLIDAGGNVRRRFIGARPVEVLEQMIDEIDPPTGR